MPISKPVTETTNAYKCPQCGREVLTCCLRMGADASKEVATEQWQPIETAPKDGTWQIIAKFDHTGLLWWYKARYSERMGYWVMPGGSCTPTHWLPLPTTQVGASASASTTTVTDKGSVQHEYEPDAYRVCKHCGAQGDVLCAKGQPESVSSIQSVVAQKAREALIVLRDAVRDGRQIGFKERDPLVMAIFAATDLVDSLKAENEMLKGAWPTGEYPLPDDLEVR